MKKQVNPLIIIDIKIDIFYRNYFSIFFTIDGMNENEGERGKVTIWVERFNTTNNSTLESDENDSMLPYFVEI